MNLLHYFLWIPQTILKICSKSALGNWWIFYKSGVGDLRPHLPHSLLSLGYTAFDNITKSIKTVCILITAAYALLSGILFNNFVCKTNQIYKLITANFVRSYQSLNLAHKYAFYNKMILCVKWVSNWRLVTCNSKQMDKFLFHTSNYQFLVTSDFRGSLLVSQLIAFKEKITRCIT